MGEDRWLCSLMIYAGWRLEYAAAADCETHCPEEFEEFYKQRRRWIPSTIANLSELCARGIRFPVNIDSVSYLFLFYEVALLFSTIIGPGTVVLIMAAGLQYAFSPSFHTLWLLTQVSYSSFFYVYSMVTSMSVATKRRRFKSVRYGQLCLLS